MDLRDDKMTIEKLETAVWEQANTSYGKQKFKTKDGGKVKWEIEINYFLRTIVIGISEGDKSGNSNFWDSSNSESIHYAVGINGGHHRVNDDDSVDTYFYVDEGDIIYLELDMNENTLSFNGGTGYCRNKVFTNIKHTDIGYSLAVYLRDWEDSVTIKSLEYSCG